MMTQFSIKTFSRSLMAPSKANQFFIFFDDTISFYNTHYWDLIQDSQALLSAKKIQEFWNHPWLTNNGWCLFLQPKRFENFGRFPQNCTNFLFSSMIRWIFTRGVESSMCGDILLISNVQTTRWNKKVFQKSIISEYLIIGQ